MEKSDYTVFIGRFQPFTNAHLALVREALAVTKKKVLIVIGSYRATPTIRNPWTYEERRDMILDTLRGYRKGNAQYGPTVETIPLRDHMYNDTAWISALQNKIARELENADDTVQLIGHFKDDSSYYLKFFPQWPLIKQPAFMHKGKVLDATNVRNILWEEKDYYKIEEMVPKAVYDHIMIYLRKSTSGISDFSSMVKEYEFLKDYKKIWKDTPFPPVFVTADAVTVQSGHILIVRRGGKLGKGLFALPGGFINPDEPIEQSAIRELKEETCIDIPSIVLKKSIKTSHVFDHPQRSLRGRTITHAYLIELDSLKPLPAVKGADDADQAFWMSFNDVILNENRFFEDHIHIIDYFLRNVQR